MSPVTSSQATETSIRQMIANGKSKTALENAKQFHKTRNDAASESLLLDAYAARIQSLLDQNMTTEAKSLADLLRERFPSARERFNGLKAASAARGGDVDGLMQTLADPELNAEQRAAAEQIVATQVTDLAAIASSTALPPEHSLRRAAAALERAFHAVTSGPVKDEQIALPEVSHRSPLSAWKLLIRAIACLHRGEEEACIAALDAIRPETVPARLIPAMHAMLGRPTGGPLNPAGTALVSRTAVSLKELREALVKLDEAFEEEDDDSRLLKAIRAAVRECQRSAPERLGELKQIISVRGALDGLGDERVNAALEGAPRPDARYFRMFASTMESTGDPQDLALACGAWDQFRVQAEREGWFRAGSVEEAVLYLHMAGAAGRMPDEIQAEMRRSRGTIRKASGTAERVEDITFLYPEKLYAMACAADPHPESFSQWMKWAGGQSVAEAEKVAKEWSKTRPEDIEPVLFMMKEAAKRRAFPTALSYLEKAERIDAVHSDVRAARLRLLAAGALRHLEQKKPHLAEEKLAAFTALPQSRQGERPAFAAALRHIICLSAGDKARAEEARLELEGLLGNRVAASIAIAGLASAAKLSQMMDLPWVWDLSRANRKLIPRAFARFAAIKEDLAIDPVSFQSDYLDEAEKQVPKVGDTLTVEELRRLGDMGMATERERLAWAVSEAGLKKGGPSEACFLLLRARAMPPADGTRRLALAAAAVELGRFHRDMETVDRAVEIVRNPFGGDSVSLTPEQARDVVRKELASPAYPAFFSPGPNYNDLMPASAECDCPDCRRRRGEEVDEDEFDEGEFDEAAMEEMFYDRAPKDMPPDVAKAMFEVVKESFLNGETPDEIINRAMGGAAGKKKHGKRRR